MRWIARLSRRAALVLTLPVAVAVPVSAAEPGVAPIAVQSRIISQFRMGSPQTRFGALEFVGGLAMTAAADFGGLSAFRYLDCGRTFLG
ncbi:MAG: esterase-like activity of phytase family protein, partial [Phyllobacterium sp.]